MKKSRFSEEQIIGFLRQAEASMPVKKLCRQGGFSDATFYMYGLPVECKPATDMASAFLMIEGKQTQDFCCVSTSPFPVDLTEHPDCPFLVGVTTRGNLDFAAVVAYAFCKRTGTRVFNDSGVLNGQAEYDAQSLKLVLAA